MGVQSSIEQPALPLRQVLTFEHPHGLVRGSVVGKNRQHEPLTVVLHVTALHDTFRLEPATDKYGQRMIFASRR